MVIHYTVLGVLRYTRIMIIVNSGTRWILPHCFVKLTCSKCGGTTEKRGYFKNPVCFECKRNRRKEHAKKAYYKNKTVDKKLA